MGEKTMKQKHHLSAAQLAVFLIGSAVLFGSCYPGDITTTAETDIVATFFDKSVDFSTKMTYARPDQVVNINDQTLGTSYDATIVSQIDQNMASLGFTRVTDPAQADVHIVPLAAASTWVGGSCYPAYWGGWYGYPSGWGWCYPDTYSFQTGTLLLVMVNPQSASGSPGLWIAGINGLLEGSTAEINARINKNINQAFTQSPYLGAGK